MNKNEMLIVEAANGRLQIYFAYDKLVSKKIKDFPYHKWNKNEKCWTIPYAEHYLAASCKNFADDNKIKLIVEKPAVENRQIKRLSQTREIPAIEIVERIYLKIREIQYSEKTLKLIKMPLKNSLIIIEKLI
ncbi:MAG: hypothetical protein IPI10_13600 [Bacteroidetes bacterium]|nr:hypothetical protein [Bacteroidota bacterium]